MIRIDNLHCCPIWAFFNFSKSASLSSYRLLSLPSYFCSYSYIPL